MSTRRHPQYNHTKSHTNNNNNNHDLDDVDITEGNPVYDIRVVAFKRQIKQLKEKIELQTELNRKLEFDKNTLESQLASYKKRCCDLQKNLDDKDQHLNEVVASLTIQHSKTIPVKKNKKNKQKSGWFGFGTPKSSNHTLTTPNITFNTPSPINSPSVDINEDIDNYNDILPCMTAPLGSSLPITRPRRHGSVHIIDGSGDIGVYVGTGTSSLIGIDRSEMEFKIKNSSKDKLRSYTRDLYDKYYILDKEKNQLFHDLVKATHNQGWTEKQALNKDKQAKTAIEKEKNAKNHIKMLEKSLNKERKKIDKYRITFEDFKSNAIKKRKEMLCNDKKLKDIICMKDEFIQRACYKLILYKDRLSQFEIPVFQEYLVLISPNIQDLIRYDSEGMNGPGSSQNLSALHEEMVQKQTPGGPGFTNEDVNSAGGTVTSIASVNSSVGRHKSSSRKSSAASASANDHNYNDEIGDINDIDASNNNKKNKKKKRKNKKKIRVKSDDRFDGDDLKEESVNIPITAKAKFKKKRKKSKRKNSENRPESLSNLSKKVNKKKKKKQEKEKKKAAERMAKLKEKIEKAEEDYLEMDLDDMVSSSSSSSSSSEEEFLLLSDSGENIPANTILEYALDEKGKYIENTHNNNKYDGISNNLSNYVELKLVKYPGTGELFVVIIKFEDKKDAMEIFRCDFAKCLNIEKNQIEEDFSIMFEYITLVFRGDDYEKVMGILINLRVFFEQHCTNLQPELPPPPEQTVTDQMNIFFGGGF